MSPRSPTVVLSGELDMYGAPAVRRLLDAITGPGAVDMREVRYLDASALTELVRVARRVGARQVTLLVASKNVRKVLDIVGFDEIFTIVDVSRSALGTLASA
jgi:anti-anti-sigma factor